jgi:hypothetical protein
MLILPERPPNIFARYSSVGNGESDSGPSVDHRPTEVPRPRRADGAYSGNRGFPFSRLSSYQCMERDVAGSRRPLDGGWIVFG